MDLLALFYNGVGDQSVSETEKALLQSKGFDFNYDTICIRTQEADRITRMLFGLSLTETSGIGLDKLIFSSEHSCYYWGATGANIVSFVSIQAGWRKADSSVVLHYTRDELERTYAVTLSPTDTEAGYCFKSNLPLE